METRRAQTGVELAPPVLPLRVFLCGHHEGQSSIRAAVRQLRGLRLLQAPSSFAVRVLAVVVVPFVMLFALRGRPRTLRKPLSSESELPQQPTEFLTLPVLPQEVLGEEAVLRREVGAHALQAIEDVRRARVLAEGCRLGRGDRRHKASHCWQRGRRGRRAGEVGRRLLPSRHGGRRPVCWGREGSDGRRKPGETRRRSRRRRRWPSP